MMNQSPCRYCQERVVGCHSSCQKYKDYSAENSRLKEEEKKRKIGRGNVTDYQYHEAMRRLYKNQKGR